MASCGVILPFTVRSFNTYSTAVLIFWNNVSNKMLRKLDHLLPCNILISTAVVSFLSDTVNVSKL